MAEGPNHCLQRNQDMVISVGIKYKFSFVCNEQQSLEHEYLPRHPYTIKN